MDKLQGFGEAIAYLKNGHLLTSGHFDRYYYKDERIYIRGNGSSFSLSLAEFTELYHDVIFYLYEDNDVDIDEKKDEDYYRYYHK